MTPHELLEFFVGVAPSFRKFWNSEDNLSVDDDGSFNFHSVCTEFSHFFRDQVTFKEPTLREKTWTPKIEDSKLQELFNFVEENMALDEESEDELDNALCTCFLEYIAKSKAGEYARQFMRDKSKTYFDQWNV